MKNSKHPYEALPNFILRSPLLDLNLFNRITRGKVIDNNTFKNLFSDPTIKEAIFLASPYFYFELEKWAKGNADPYKEEKIKLAFLKYITRMCTRCTPFGLFAGCTLGKIAEKTDIVINEKNNHLRHTRLDMDYLVALSNDLAKIDFIKTSLKYFPNSSLYEFGSQLRYVEYFYVNTSRKHNIVEIDKNPYLEHVLKESKKGLHYQDLVNELLKFEVSENDATRFIENLIQNQILVSELEPSVSGIPFTDQIIKVLKTLNSDCEKELQFSNKIKNDLSRLDQIIGNDPSKYLELSKYIKTYQTKFNLKYLFQTDLELSTLSCSLSNEVVDKIEKTIPILNRISKKQTETNLAKFKTAFINRYEQREMPLCHVLDVETGIGYLQNNTNSDINPLIDDLVLPKHQNPYQETKAEWNTIYNTLENKLFKSHLKSEKTIYIKDEDFIGLPTNWDNLPDTFSGVCELINDNGKTKIKLSALGGASAANLFGRFCYKESPITDYAMSIMELEEQMNPNKIMAEIVHLPEARVGNVLMRPTLRKFEIPYLAKSLLQSKSQIQLNDLFVSVKNNRIILRSKKYNKEVIPCLTNAHYYSLNALPIYQFLCDMQAQQMRKSIGLNFGPLSNKHSFLPRVEYNDVILHEARWFIEKNQIQSLLNVKLDTIMLQKETVSFINKYEIPKYASLKDNDNEILINFENMTSVQMLLDMVKNRNWFILKEFLHSENSFVKSADNRCFTNQIIISFYNKKKTMLENEEKGTYASA